MEQRGRLVKQQGETYVQGLSEFSVKSVEETFELLQTAERNRKTRETDMNSLSSRSHSIFQVGGEQIMDCVHPCVSVPLLSSPFLPLMRFIVCRTFRCPLM